MDQAIHPDSFSDFRKLVKKLETENATDDEKEISLSVLADHAGWSVLKEYINNLRSDITNLNKSMMERGASFEDIGRNAVVSQLAQDLLTKIIQRVDDAHESVRNQPKPGK
jgi:hypothetical protein